VYSSRQNSKNVVGVPHLRCRSPRIAGALRRSSQWRFTSSTLNRGSKTQTTPALRVVTVRRWLSFQHLACQCIVFHGSLLLKIRRKLRSRKVDDRVFPSCWTRFQHWALVGSTWDQSIYRSLFDESAENSLENLLMEGYVRVFQSGLSLCLFVAFCKLRWSTDVFFLFICRHTASPPITAGMHAGDVQE